MIISKGKRKNSILEKNHKTGSKIPDHMARAQVVIREDIGGGKKASTTKHLLLRNGQWTDKFGQIYKVD